MFVRSFLSKPFKEVISCYAENTDELVLPTFNLHIYPALHLTSLLPVDLECSVDEKAPITLKSSQLELLPFGNKSSTLTFTVTTLLFSNGRTTEENFAIDSVVQQRTVGFGAGEFE